METMTEAHIIRTDEQGETIKIFENGSLYERLKPGDVVEVEMDENGNLRDYFVDEIKWDFGNFGNTIAIHIKPVAPEQPKMSVRLPPWSSNFSHSIHLPPHLPPLPNTNA